MSTDPPTDQTPADQTPAQDGGAESVETPPYNPDRDIIGTEWRGGVEPPHDEPHIVYPEHGQTPSQQR